jgi:hypothetical protein
MRVGISHVMVLKRGESPMLTFGHPEVYIGRQLCVLFCYGEQPYASLLVDSLKKAESLPIWLVYTVFFYRYFIFFGGIDFPS